jgi:hypothetical protein
MTKGFLGAFSLQRPAIGMAVAGTIPIGMSWDSLQTATQDAPSDASDVPG